MKVILATVVALTTAIVLCSAADPECKERQRKGLPLHWPNPTDCGRFYRCTTKNVKREVICPPEREYNQKTGKCALRGKGVCTPMIQIPVPLEDDDDVCSGKSDATNIPVAGTCRDFYVCANEVAIQQSCLIGSIFNITEDACVPDPTATCWQNACNGLADDTILADPTSCLNYYQCEANDVNLQTCLAGDYFNVTDGSCLADVGYTNCWENFCINEPDSTYLPKPGTCRDFYVCANKLANPQSCLIGSIFNTTAKACVPDPTAICWQNACNGLADGIILADANSCTSYYECEANDVVVKTCPAGNYFDKTTLSCLEGECPVETCSCPGGYNEGDMIPHPTDCNSFYICINRELLEQSCQPGNYFDCEKNACLQGDCTAASNNVHARKSRSSFLDITNFEADIEDNDDVITIDEDTLEPSSDQQIFKALDEAIEPSDQLISKELNEAIDNTDAVQPLEENLKLSDSSAVIVPEIHNVPIEIEIPPPVVTPEPFKWEAAMELMCLDRYYEGDIIADPDNCQQYKVCLNAQFIVESCGTGARFDEDLLVCQRDEDDACSQTLIKKIVATINGPYDCTCPGGYTGGQRLPHADCDKYYICNGENGTLQEQKCGVGNFYNKATELCEVDTTGDCWPLDECTCPGNIQPGAQVAHPSVCRMYYICDGSNGTLLLSDCGAGNRFDNDTKLCVEDTCGLCNPPADICKDQTNNTLVANPTECFSFYLCINNEPTLGVCNETEWFDPFYGICTVDTNAQCRNPCESISGIMFLPHPDCTKFFFCNDGVATVVSCDPDQSFNATLNICRPGTSNCGGAAVCTGQPDGTYFPVTDDDTKFYYCLNGTGIVTDCLPGTTFNPKLEICLLQPSDNCEQTICATQKDGFIAPTKDHQSASFCECRDGEAFLVNCLDGYTFNETELICTTNASCDPAICPYSPDYTYFPNKNDMHSFCLCITNEALIIECPKNGTYNPSIMECQLPAPQDPNCNPTECLIAPPYFAFPSLTADDNTTFCICVDGGATLLDCPTGYTFNETLGICYSNVPPFDITLCQGNETFFPVPNNIYAFYYCSDANTVQLINCPVNTVYDQKYKACLEDPCDQTVCEDPAMLDSPYAALGNPYIFCMCEEVPAGSTNLYANWYACDPNTMFSPKYNVCLSESINPDCDVALCNVDDFVGLTIPAINDPYGFCYCTSASTAVKYSCNDGMKYDAIKGVCAHDLLCNGKYTQFEVTANPEACNKYYLCFNGDLLNLTCNTGLYFNTTALNCLPNDKNQCILLDDDCTCPGGYKAGDFLPHPTDCSLYYICSAGKLVQTPCGPNNYFDIVSKTCQKDVTGCCPASATRTCVGNYREGEFVPHPTSSQSYYICTNARLMPASCGLGNVFDRKLQTCTKAPKALTTNYKWKRSSSFDEMQDVRTLFKIKPMIKKLTGSFGNLFA